MVNRYKRLTIYTLLFIFGVLSLKNLVPELVNADFQNCDEIGHIHVFHSHQPQKSQLSNKPSYQQERRDTDEDESCHAGKSVFAYSLYPVEVHQIQLISLKEAFDLVFNLKNNFENPDLEPHRKPPRAHS